MSIRVIKDDCTTVSPSRMLPSKIGVIVEAKVPSNVGKVVQRVGENLIEIGTDMIWINLEDLSEMKIRILPPGTVLEII